jgi:protoporphyrinogen oxidase
MLRINGEPTSAPIAVIGAGPAGLTAAHVLARREAHAVVFEAEDQVGGLCRTVEYDGARFDIGGHRFFTKVPAIEQFWRQILGDELRLRPRLSRIYFDGRYFAYPLRARDIVRRVGLLKAALCLASYLAVLPQRKRRPKTFEEWVTSRFGRRLYRTFFRSYTLKIWGIPGSEIRSQWAAQRIRNFSLFQAILSILGLRRRHVTTLIEEFLYPRLGPGQMWEALAAEVTAAGVPIHLAQRCVALRHDRERIESVVVSRAEGVDEYPVAGVVSTMPVNELVLRLEPPATPEVLAAARRLRYRSMCVVALVTTEPEPFPDNWIYLHDPGTSAGRVQNFGAWSPDMVRPGTTCLGVEYFCSEGDELWEMPEAEMVDLARRELAAIGLIDPACVVGGKKVRVREAYPMYDATYEEALGVVRRYLSRFANLHTCGRNGLHRYNNMDHSMWTAVLATLNALDGTSLDVWNVNTEETYLEERFTCGHMLASVLGGGAATNRDSAEVVAAAAESLSPAAA